VIEEEERPARVEENRAESQRNRRSPARPSMRSAAPVS
jgi:hypothetical protein